MTTSYVRGTETDLRTVKDRFGGIDTPAALGGLLALIGTLAFLGALIGAGAGELSYQLNAIDIDGNLQEIEVLGLVIAGLVVLAASFVGGWVAARMARFDGVMNGIGVAIWLLLLVAVFAALGAFVGAEFNAFQRVGLPDWFSQFSADDVTAGVIVGGVVGIAALFIGAALGGFVGDAYNRRVDAAITDRAVRPAEDLR
ncbi:MAG TPA: hypothetical protein VLB67_11420 [Acidimicrobiia bacterium]|nr:hypothetical protein [Acidimicrobiia bacterium]